MFRTYYNDVTNALPVADALDLQDISVSITDTDPQPAPDGPGTASSDGSDIFLYAAPTSANISAGLSSDYVVVGEVIPQGSNTGTTDVPECPGYVIPNGYQLYAVPTGGEAAAAADVFANGYLIPSSDAPSTPAAGQLGLSNPLTRAKG